MMLSFINAAKHDVSLTCFHFNTEEQSTYKFNANVDGGICGYKNGAGFLRLSTEMLNKLAETPITLILLPLII